MKLKTTIIYNYCRIKKIASNRFEVYNQFWRMRCFAKSLTDAKHKADNFSDFVEV